MRYYVYVYKDPETLIPFYIGKGSGKRMYRHLQETVETTDNLFKFNKIQKILKAGNIPIVEKVCDI